MSQSTSRDFPATASPQLLAPEGTRWAVIVGVSKYASADLDLRYAHRDAQTLHALLTTTEGGNFPPEHIALLCDEEATTRALTRALRGFLLEAGENDLVLLFFACHGGPDPRRPAGPLYLYTHDTDPSDVAGTALAMDEIYRSLEQLITARRVVVIADTCHSAGIGGQLARTRSTATAEVTNQYLDRLARSHEGTALLTSAAASESSLEDPKWGGGHGVFTHFLLEGMGGAADGYGGEKDGIVSIRELFEYVRDQVQEATDGRQHPTIGTTRFDPTLPMAITGDLDVEQHLALGRSLMTVGWLLDDPAPMLLAARQFGVAAELKRVLPSARAERGRALLAAGDHAGAVAELAATLRASPDAGGAESHLHLGMALAEQGRWVQAARSVETFLGRSPGSPDASLARTLLDWLRRPAGSVHAVLIGVGAFPEGSRIGPLAGPVNDVALMSGLITELFDDRPVDVLQLIDTEATCAEVLRTLRDLRDRVSADDSVIVYFSGHSMADAGLDDAFLITHDSTIEGGHETSILGVSISDLLDAVALDARDVLLVLDTHLAPVLLDEVERRDLSNLTMLSAAGVGEMAYEVNHDGRPFGAFTVALAENWRNVGPAGTYGELHALTDQQVLSSRAHVGQNVQLLGPADGRVLRGRFAHADLWHAERRTLPRPRDIAILDNACAELDAPLAQRARARRWLHDGQPATAAALLVDCVDRSADRWLELALARLALDDADGAAAALEEVTGLVDEQQAATARAATRRFGSAPSEPPAIWVIAPWPQLASGKSHDRPREIGRMLAAAVGAPEAEIEFVLGAGATTATMRSVLTRCARLSTGRLCVVAFVGELVRTDRLAYRLADRVAAVADLWPRARVSPDQANILGLVLDHPTMTDLRHRDITGFHHLDPLDDVGFDVAVATQNATMTDQLLASLTDAWSAQSTYAEWTAPTGATLLPSSAASLRVMDRSPRIRARHDVEGLVRRAALEAARLAADAIERRRIQHEEHPEGQLQRGLALAAAGDRPGAVAALRAARNLYDDPSVRATELTRDPGMERWQMESRYHYARLLLDERGDLYDVVATLQAALAQAPDDPRVLLTLVRAIQALVERESLVEARTHARQYLRMGAPLGDAEALRAFVREGPAAPR